VDRPNTQVPELLLKKGQRDWNPLDPVEIFVTKVGIRYTYVQMKCEMRWCRYKLAMAPVKSDCDI